MVVHVCSITNQNKKAPPHAPQRWHSLLLVWSNDKELQKSVPEPLKFKQSVAGFASPFKKIQMYLNDTFRLAGKIFSEYRI